MTWSLKGEMVVNCNCDVFCPCVISLGKHPPTEGYCQAWFGIRIDEGNFEDAELSGLNVGLLLDIPGLMSRGNYTMAGYVDEACERRGIRRFAAHPVGAGGRQYVLFKLLVSNLLGFERAPIDYVVEGEKRHLRVGEHTILGEVEPLRGTTPRSPS